jgi:single-strand DNA-binding protein
VVIAGNTTRDVEVRRTQSGMPIASFGVAVNERRKNNQTGQWDDYANYFDVTAFGERWEKLAQYMPKGTKVTVQGRLRWSQWERDGQKRAKVEIIAEEVELPPKPRGGYQQGYQNGNQGGYQQGYQQGNQGGTYQASTSTAGPPIEVEATVYDEDIPFN